MTMTKNGISKVPVPAMGEIVLYRTEDGDTRIECRFAEGTLWLTQALIAKLFQTTPQNITLHLKAIYKDGELSETATCKEYLQVQQEGKRQVTRSMLHYNLSAILAVGYRFAVTGKTAPELIASRANHAKPNMGLTVWRRSVVRREDVCIAKNYLREREISELNRIVTMFLDFAEDQASRRRQIFMRDWKQRLDDFLKLHDRSILPDAGRVSREAAERIAVEQYELFDERRRIGAEFIAESESMKALEETVKKLSKKP